MGKKKTHSKAIIINFQASESKIKMLTLPERKNRSYTKV